MTNATTDLTLEINETYTKLQELIKLSSGLTDDGAIEFPDEVIAHVNELYDVNDQIWRLELRKKDLQKILNPFLLHSNKTSKSFTVGNFLVTSPSSYYWKLKKDVYEELRGSMPNSVRDSVKVIEKYELKYEVDEETINKIQRTGTSEEKALIDKFLTLAQRDVSLRVVKGRG